MAEKSLPQFQGVGDTDNLVHLWVKIKGYQCVAICDPDLHSDEVGKGRKGDLCPVCVTLGMKEPKG